MKFGAVSLVAVLSVAIGAPLSRAEDAKEEKKVEYHCEKKEKDGTTTDIPAASKDECKKSGGKWAKKHDGEHKHN